MLIAPSCKKAETTKENLTENEKLLTSHGWHNSSIRNNDIEITLPPWSIDDCWFFRPDGTFTYSYGSLRSLQKEKDWDGTWEFSDDEKTLIYASTSPSISLSESEMLLSIIFEGETRLYTYINCK
jgi:hypothetical protein